MTEAPQAAKPRGLSLLASSRSPVTTRLCESLVFSAKMRTSVSHDQDDAEFTGLSGAKNDRIPPKSRPRLAKFSNFWKADGLRSLLGLLVIKVLSTIAAFNLDAEWNRL